MAYERAHVELLVALDVVKIHGLWREATATVGARHIFQLVQPLPKDLFALGFRNLNRLNVSLLVGWVPALPHVLGMICATCIRIFQGHIVNLAYYEAS